MEIINRKDSDLTEVANYANNALNAVNNQEARGVTFMNFNSSFPDQQYYFNFETKDAVNTEGILYGIKSSPATP